MINQHISQIIQRDLAKVKEELRQYHDPAAIWSIVPGTANSGGNLALHIAGNLRHFIGAVMGDTGYVRERDLEFSQKNVDVTILYALIDTTLAEITPVLDNIGTAALTAEFPKEVGGMKRDTLYILLHLMAHLSYHLGQINYHRRIVAAL